MKKLSLLAFCIMMACASAFAGTEPKFENENAVVHIYRPSRLVGFGWNFKLKVKAGELIRVKNGKHVTLQLAPGEAEFEMYSNFIEMELEPGKHYYLRASLVRNAFLGKPEIVEVTERQGKEEIASLN